MDQDISKKTIVVLLMVTVVLTAIGTWLMVTSKPEAVLLGNQFEPTPQAGGQVSFTLLEREITQGITTGLITLDIRRR